MNPASQPNNPGAATTAEPVRDDRFPAGIPYIVGNEAAERFSFYGLRQILYVYLVSLFIGFAAESTIPGQQLADAKVHAIQITHLFNAGVYLFPIIGAVLADRFLGKVKVIFWISLLYCCGNAATALAGHLGAQGNVPGATWAIYGGLALIALGSGGIKPCVSANVGDQFTTRNAHLVGGIFQIFYFTVNFGSFFASVLTPYLIKKYGAAVAFGVPGVLMAVSTLIFWLGRGRFIEVPPRPGGKLGALDFVASSFLAAPLLLFVLGGSSVAEELVRAAMTSTSGAVPHAAVLLLRDYWVYVAGALFAFGVGLALFRTRQRIQQDSGFIAILLYSFNQRNDRQPGDDFWAPARRKFGEEAAEGPPAVLRIIVVFSMITVFWALFDQHSSTWVEQAKSMDLTLIVPGIVWYWFAVPAMFVCAGFGALWLFRWVSNRPLPRWFNLSFFGAMGIWLVITIVQQSLHGASARIDLLPAQIAALNPLLVMIIIPALNFAVYRPLDKRGIPLKPLQRIGIGMFLGATAFGAVALLQARIQHVGPGHIPVLWQLIPFTLLTTAEVLVSVTGLEFAYTQAPRAMKSTIMGFWLLCITMGNVLVAFLAPLESLSLETFFWTFAGLMLAAAVIFVILASFYRGKTYLQAG